MCTVVLFCDRVWLLLFGGERRKAMVVVCPGSFETFLSCVFGYAGDRDTSAWVFRPSSGKAIDRICRELEGVFALRHGISRCLCRLLVHRCVSMRSHGNVSPFALGAAAWGCGGMLSFYGFSCSLFGYGYDGLEPKGVVSCAHGKLADGFLNSGEPLVQRTVVDGRVSDGVGLCIGVYSEEFFVLGVVVTRGIDMLPISIMHLAADVDLSACGKIAEPMR